MSIGNCWLTQQNYPFCTIDPSESRALVPDPRFDWLVAKYAPNSIIAAFLTVVDIAGLVKGASQGQGLGNNFLSNIKATDVKDPCRDIDIIRTELRLKDAEHLDGMLQKKSKSAGNASGTYEKDLLEYVRHLLLDKDTDARLVDWTREEADILNKIQLLSAKPVVYLVNLSEEDYVKGGNIGIQQVQDKVKAEGTGDFIIGFSGELEEFLTTAGSDAEKAELLKSVANVYGVESVESALPKIIWSGYRAMKLQHFFTCGDKEVRAWTIRAGTKGPQAAAVIHSDFEKNFIAAEVIRYDDLKALGSEEQVKSAGKLLTRGKESVIDDGDIVVFKLPYQDGTKIAPEPADLFPLALDADVCYATEYGGLKGKLRVNPKGRHSFVDLDSKTSPTVTKVLDRSSPSRLTSSAAAAERNVDRDSGDSEKERGRVKDRAEVRGVAGTAAANLKKRSTSADAWRQLVTKETKNRTKFYGTEKTLLVLLEEERSRFTQLEEEYHKLLGEVHALQASHLQDLRNIERRADSDLKNLQKAMIAKTEETKQVQQELQQFQGRYHKESTTWIAANGRLEAHVKQLDRLLKDMEKRADSQDKLILELSGAKKELTDSNAAKDAELKKLNQQLKERETEWTKEKETRMKLEVQALQLDHFVAQRDEEIKSLRSQLQKKTTENEELGRVRSQLQDARADLDDLTKRERMYLDEIEQLTLRERKAFNELEDLSAVQKRTLNEVDRLASREAALLKELEQVRGFEAKLHQELLEVRTKLNQESEEVANLTKQNRVLQADNSKLNQDLFEARALAHEYKLTVEQRELDIQNLKESEFQLRREKDDAKLDISSRQNEIVDLQKQLQDIARRLEVEMQSKLDIKHQNKEKLVAVAEKISDLQDALGETQLQISEMKEREDSLRIAVRQRDDSIAQLQRQITEQQQTISDLEARVARESYLNETLKAKKKEELLALQDKFTAAKSAMEQEAQQLRNQLTQRQVQAHASLDEVSRLKIEVSELTADRFRLEARLTELSALEASHSRQISHLQQQLRQRDQEFSLLSIKHQSLIEQLKRVDDELQILKASSSVLKDVEGGRLQMNIGDLSRRIRTQLGALSDAGGSPSTVGSSTVAGLATGPAFAVSSPLKAASAKYPSSRNVAGASSTADLRNIAAAEKDSDSSSRSPASTVRRGAWERDDPREYRLSSLTRASTATGVSDSPNRLQKERGVGNGTTENRPIAGLDDFQDFDELDLLAPYHPRTSRSTDVWTAKNDPRSSLLNRSRMRESSVGKEGTKPVVRT
ncbi:Obg-like ATPase [Phlyctochytrium bullatum]|nr:Obg-like ATPase [Phlyctochytrium bullatum]